MVDIQTIISEAGASGVSLSKIREASKLKDSDLDQQLKHLRSQRLIAGPFKYGRGFLYYAKGYEPDGESVAMKIEALIRNTGAKLTTAKTVEGKIPLPFKNFFKDGVRALVAAGRAAELKGGSSVYLLHVDVVRQLFPNIDATDEYPAKISGPEPTRSRSLKEQVVHAYHALKAEQGGLGAVSIGKLRNRVGCSTHVLHTFLLEEARSGTADLHPTTLVDLSPEDREGALPIPGTTDSAITVTLR
jgi:hypothetical protein